MCLYAYIHSYRYVDIYLHICVKHAYSCIYIYRINNCNSIIVYTCILPY